MWTSKCQPFIALILLGPLVSSESLLCKQCIGKSLERVRQSIRDIISPPVYEVYPSPLNKVQPPKVFLKPESSRVIHVHQPQLIVKPIFYPKVDSISFNNEIGADRPVSAISTHPQPGTFGTPSRNEQKQIQYQNSNLNIKLEVNGLKELTKNPQLETIPQDNSGKIFSEAKYVLVTLSKALLESESQSASLIQLQRKQRLEVHLQLQLLKGMLNNQSSLSLPVQPESQAELQSQLKILEVLLQKLVGGKSASETNSYTSQLRRQNQLLFKLLNTELDMLSGLKLQEINMGTQHTLQLMSSIRKEIQLQLLKLWRVQENQIYEESESQLKSQIAEQISTNWQLIRLLDLKLKKQSRFKLMLQERILLQIKQFEKVEQISSKLQLPRQLKQEILLQLRNLKQWYDTHIKRQFTESQVNSLSPEEFELVRKINSQQLIRNPLLVQPKILEFGENNSQISSSSSRITSEKSLTSSSNSSNSESQRQEANNGNSLPLGQSISKSRSESSSKTSSHTSSSNSTSNVESKIRLVPLNILSG
ncbi:accessory gland protein Acp36DE [Drosophila erecta]|uniref:accessory gland protein Acp36DE n=1 Tax=Drosophila erecta TaxID=7220 RepID=UPI000F062200|nr:accessory gland protein Acp36DE [Drosophila erecta]